MDKEVLVYVELNGQPVLAGHLWAHSRKSRETATYEYEKDWLNRPESFAIEPALMLGPGPFFSGVKSLHLLGFPGKKLSVWPLLLSMKSK